MYVGVQNITDEQRNGYTDGFGRVELSLKHALHF